MPAFDPVRDAAGKFPLTQSPSPLARTDLPSSRPATATSTTSTASPLTRRATDLAVLLNDDPAESSIFTPTAVQRLPRSLSDLLQPVDPLPDKLGLVEPFHRSSLTPQSNSTSPSQSAVPFTFGINDLQSPLTVPLRPPASPPPLSSSRPSTSSSIPSQSSRRRSPVIPNKSPVIQSHKASSTEPPKQVAMPPPPPPQKSTSLPYNPRNRISPPISILNPLSPQEIEFYKDPDKSRIGWAKLTKKRKRDPNEDGHLSPYKKSKDVGLVVSHYNNRPEVGIKMRQESPIIGLKNFNNWIKSVLFANFGHPALASSPYSISASGRKGGPVSRGKVLDMGCGKGGDLNKWAKAHVNEYIGLDVAAVSVEQARQRHETLKGSRFEATFVACDCYVVSLSSVLDPQRLVTPFDVVSMQFCMHYAFETEQKARRMLENVTRWLRDGGTFVGTIPNARQLINRLRDSPEHSFGNSIYNIRTDEPIPKDDDMPTFGLRYWFWLKDAVENVPEYIVHWDHFVQLASEYNLELKYHKEFHDIFDEFNDHSEFGPLMQRMKVVNPDGGSQMDEIQWEAANIYVAFVFEKH